MGIVNNSRQPIKAHSNKIVSEMLKDCSSKAAICNKCKNPRSSLQLWQQDSKRAGLSESLFLKCSICEEKTFVKTSKCVSEENRHAEINMKVVQAGLLTGNGLSSLQRICTTLNLPQPPTSNSYNEILKRVAEASCSEAHGCLMRAGENLKRKFI